MTDAAATELPTMAPPSPQSDRSRSLWSDAWHQLRRNPVFIFSALVVLVVVSMAAFPGVWTGGGWSPFSDPVWREQGFFDLTQARQAPGGGHLMGTSTQGGDLYTLLVYGARPSLTVAIAGAVGTLLIGATLGALAGYFGGWTDTIISRFTDVVLGLPFILGAIVLLSVFRSRSVLVLSFVIMVLAWTTLTRIMRGAVLQARAMDYVEAARALGAKHSWILLRHILPNSVAPVIVYFTIIVGVFVGLEATLTFLGVGLQAGEPSWGIQIDQGRLPALNGEPHLLVFPCAFLVITVLSFVLLGDALRDALDPKTR